MAKTMQEIQKEVDTYISQYEEGYFPPMSLIVRMTEELGELAREVNHVYGEKKKKPIEETGSIEMELGDLLFVIICMANQLNINLDEAFQKVMHKYNTRDKERWTKKTT
ncbi:nucleotide pyrophosphohydrolase [Desulfuribacillus alkaliarsenatis]|uniref:Nucleotide pyrophosphohydrolase n=1 Tax=Desulfuribacillus alkaliarsenatis TaxID=766136 RepID=A0A1E5G6B4_9FIRM|nr:nucleotide pyrophosphohydrolase [Desulfuribacillus alkaliarsenatis]